MFDSTSAYVATINWEGRLRREIPFLIKLVKEMATLAPGATILDAGCGPGFQAVELARELPGFTVRGIDVDPSMVDHASRLAVERGVKVDFITGAIQDGKKMFETANDFVYSLGNSLALAWGDDPRSLFGALRDIISPGGFLFFQVLNSDHPRQGYVLSPLARLDDGSEVMTLKRFAPDLEKRWMDVEFVTITRQAGTNKQELHVTAAGWKLVGHEELNALLKEMGFQVKETWGAYDGAPFVPGSSDNLLCLARRTG